MDFRGIVKDTLKLRNIRLADRPSENATKYRVRFLDADRRAIMATSEFESTSIEINIPVTVAMMASAKGYLRLEITAWEDGDREPRPAHFHLRSIKQGGLMVAGISH